MHGLNKRRSSESTEMLKQRYEMGLKKDQREEQFSSKNTSINTLDIEELEECLRVAESTVFGFLQFPCLPLILFCIQLNSCQQPNRTSHQNNIYI